MLSESQTERIMAATKAKVERVRAANRWDEGALVIPFVCYSCEKQKCDFCLVTGDGLPLCCECFGDEFTR